MARWSAVLYASGFSPHEIESIMTSLNWQDAFATGAT